MAERAFIFERPRIGVEDPEEPGRVGAGLVLQSLTMTAVPNLPRTPIRSNGRLASVGVTGGKESTAITAEGPLTFTDIGFLFSSILCKPVVTGAGNAKTATWIPDPENPNELANYTVEGGSSAGSMVTDGVHFNDLTLSFSANPGDTATISASGMGKAYDEGNDLTEVTVDVPLEPVSMEQVCVRVADTVAGLAQPAALLKRLVSANLAFSGRQSELFTIDCTEPSFSTALERFFEKTAQIVVMQDAQGIALMNRMRNKAIYWVQYQAIGRQINGTDPAKYFTLTLTFPVFGSGTDRSEQNDMFAATYDMELAYIKDDIFGAGKGGFIKAELQTLTTTITQFTTASALAPVDDIPTDGPGLHIVATPENLQESQEPVTP